MVAPPGCCEICQIAEVLADPQLQNRSVRITGKLEAYDAQRKTAEVSFQNVAMTVETQRLALGNLRLQIGSMYQFLGETYSSNQVER
uniref:CST complex subunit Ten1 n=1 Tax=Phytophthora ramorum TaxID=164328 RepID=H3HCR0_PHYRM